MVSADVGESIPPHTPHAVSVSLPTWKSNVAYEEGEDWVLSKLTTGYPRFFIHKLISAFADDVALKFGDGVQKCMLFPSSKTAQSCLEFMTSRNPAIEASTIKIVNLVLDAEKVTSETLRKASPSISALLISQKDFSLAKQYWQHSGDGVSSRRAEFCHALFLQGLLVEKIPVTLIPNGQHKLCRGPKRYQRGSSQDKIPQSNDTDFDQHVHNMTSNGNDENRESSQFVEERYGRNLDFMFVGNAKSAVKRRIAGSLKREVDLTLPMSPNMAPSSRGVAGLSEEDVYLYPCGMNAIFHSHRTMLNARGPMKSILFGFPYVDTLKILEKFGPGCLFYGNGSAEDLDDLENRLKAGERYLALVCEFPGNPLLKSPDLLRIRKLADAYDFGVVVDETIGNLININVLPQADIVVSSLTKIFAGECNVMGGSAILNPRGKYYRALKTIAEREYEDNYWAEDALFMERNSRDFVSRIARIDHNAEVICDVLAAHPLVKEVFYPKCVPSRRHYDACRTQNGGYGGLLSITFHQKAHAVAFFDCLETAKGPSLGTNFTLSSPYVILAHYSELEWARSFGVDPNLVRVSVGLEDSEALISVFTKALRAAETVGERVKE